MILDSLSVYTELQKISDDSKKYNIGLRGLMKDKLYDDDDDGKWGDIIHYLIGHSYYFTSKPDFTHCEIKTYFKDSACPITLSTFKEPKSNDRFEDSEHYKLLSRIVFVELSPILGINDRYISNVFRLDIYNRDGFYNQFEKDWYTLRDEVIRINTAKKTPVYSEVLEGVIKKVITKKIPSKCLKLDTTTAGSFSCRIKRPFLQPIENYDKFVNANIFET